MTVQPDYDAIHPWELYCENLQTEYTQCFEEGLDIEPLKPLIDAVSALPRSAEKAALADTIYQMIAALPLRGGYAYQEPSDLSGIRALRRSEGFAAQPVTPSDALRDKLHGAWLGRICGCLLGKPVEGTRLADLVPLLQKTGNYPMRKYIMEKDIPESESGFCRSHMNCACLADVISRAPVDDDTNYTVLGARLIERFGRDFKPADVAELWLSSQPKDAYCTAERVAFVNFVNGYRPPASAIYQNPFREWIGAQIRADYFGYINPGDPETAAEMAWRDASISHVKNGVYGEMFAAAMIAAAAVESEPSAVIAAGLSQIPHTSRLYEEVSRILHVFRSGASFEACFDDILSRYDDRSPHDWCHTISNAAIVTAALLYGGGDFGRSICMAVQCGFDTDCNGATVGSVAGMICGAAKIPPEWTLPLHDRLDTSIFGVGTVLISATAAQTEKHLGNNR